MARKFEIIKRKNLPDDAKIIGFSFLKEPKEEDLKKGKRKFDFIELSNRNKIGCMKPNKKSWAYTKGYVGIDNKPNTFVEVKSRLLIIIILLFGLLVGSMLFFGGRGNTPIIPDLPSIGNFDVTDEQITRPTEDKKDEEIPTITFSGFGKYTVSEEFPSVELKNPEGNFVDMVFTLTDAESGEMIARTNKVPAGKFVYVNVMEFYKEPGVYTVHINVATFDSQTGAQMNGINQKMEVTVK